MSNMANESQKIESINAFNDTRNTQAQSNLLVFGFIKEIGATISNMIPNSIINLCDKFHCIDIEPYKPPTLIPKTWYAATRNVLDENNYLLGIELAQYFVTNYEIENENEEYCNVYLSLFYNIIALTYEDLKLPDKSERYYKMSIQSDEKTDVWLWNYSELLTQQSRYNEAKDLLQKAVQLKPDRLIYLFALAQTLECLNQNNLALEYYQQIVSKQDLLPDNGKNCLFQAVAYAKLGKANKSQTEYQKYSDLVNKDDINGNTRYAILIFMLSKYDESLEYLNKATECGRDTAFTYYYIGLIMKHKQKYIAAKYAFEKALDLCPIYPKCKTALKSLNL